MDWLEITIETASEGIEAAATALTAAGFADLVIEDQTEYEDFLEQNRAYWDYIDEQLQQQLQGLSRIKLYLEDTDTAGLARLEALLKELKARPDAARYGTLTMQVTPDYVALISKDVGPGIPDIDKAMTEGYSTANEEARTLGFGAGMGLPNMRRNADGFDIQSQVGVGTTIMMQFNLR